MTRARRRIVKGNRRGVVLGAVLVSLTIAAILFISLLGLAAAQQRQLRKQQIDLQATWLMEAGMERATARLGQDSNYTGETWRVSAQQIGGRDAGVVLCVVKRNGDSPHLCSVTVTADYPEQDRHRIRKSKTFEIGLQRGEETAQ